MLNDFLEANRDYDLKSYDELWLIIDTDTWEQETIKELAEKCKKETLYHLGLSNPCFEIWLILHLASSNEDVKTFCDTEAQKINAPLIEECIEKFEKTKNSSSCLSIKECIEETPENQRSKACKQLVQLIRRYHELQFSIPKGLVNINSIRKAIPRAKELSECNPSDDNYPEKICTSVYKLLETLTQQIE